MSILLGCPTEAPKTPKAASGDDDNNTIIPKFSISNEYIDFHSYYGEITNNIGVDLDVVVLVVSTEATPKAIGSIPSIAKIIRKFDTTTLKTRKIYIGWTDEYSKAKYNTFKATLPQTGRNSFSHLVTEESHYNNIPWIMRANKTYYLHIYYISEGEEKTFSKAFETPDYPNNATEAEDMFRGDMIGGSLFNTGLNAIERKTGEPIVIASYVSFKSEKNIVLYILPDTGNIIAQYNPTADIFGVTNTNDYVYLKFGDAPNLLFNTTPSSIFDVFMIGHQTGGHGETATGYRTFYGTVFYNRNVTVVTE